MFCKVTEPGASHRDPTPNRNRSYEDRIVAPKQIRPIRVEGNIAYVPLTQGYEAVIDAADVPLVAKWNWFAAKKPRTVYAVRNRPGRGEGLIGMHCVLMGEPSAFETDHRDGNGLNNRRFNLRVATVQQNTCNQRTRADNTSGFKGVHWHKQKGKWHAQIAAHGKRRSLGLHDTPEAAHAAYAKASARLHGEFGRLK